MNPNLMKIEDLKELLKLVKQFPFCLQTNTLKTLNFLIKRKVYHNICMKIKTM